MKMSSFIWVKHASAATRLGVSARQIKNEGEYREIGRQSTLHGMCENECMHSYFEVTKQTIKNHGIPKSLYADGSSIFFSTSKQELSIEDESGINLMHAHSSQSKGRVERCKKG